MAFPPSFVLIVDDEPEFAPLQQALLEERGIAASVASSGKEALEYGVLLTAKGAVAIVDMMMPEMDGMATIEVLKWHYPDLRYVASSGHPEKQFREKLDELGVPVFLAKPYSTDGLVEAMRVALG